MIILKLYIYIYIYVMLEVQNPQWTPTTRNPILVQCNTPNLEIEERHISKPRRWVPDSRRPSGVLLHNRVIWPSSPGLPFEILNYQSRSFLRRFARISCRQHELPACVALRAATALLCFARPAIVAALLLLLLALLSVPAGSLQCLLLLPVGVDAETRWVALLAAGRLQCLLHAETRRVVLPAAGPLQCFLWVRVAVDAEAHWVLLLATGRLQCLLAVPVAVDAETCLVVLAQGPLQCLLWVPVAADAPARWSWCHQG